MPSMHSVEVANRDHAASYRFQRLFNSRIRSHRVERWSDTVERNDLSHVEADDIEGEGSGAA